MRIIVLISTLIGGPVATSLDFHAAGAANLSAVLPTPAASAVMFAGLALVAGARRTRSNSVAD